VVHAGDSGGRDAFAVILNGENRYSFADLQGHIDGCGSGMFGYVGQTLLQNSEKTISTEAGRRTPLGRLDRSNKHEPEFVGSVLWAEGIHSQETWSVIDKVRPEEESFLNGGSHAVGHDKSAENSDCLIFQRSKASELEAISAAV
jgi:hypothetical protein